MTYIEALKINIEKGLITHEDAIQMLTRDAEMPIKNAECLLGLDPKPKDIPQEGKGECIRSV